MPIENAPKVETAGEAGISGAPPPPGQRILSREERVEYRDQDGNLLDPEEVEALKGKVEFKTKYETRTRVVDAYGNEIQMPEEGWPDNLEEPGVAPPHPDVQGVDQETKSLVPDEPLPPKKSKDGDVEAEASKPKPASEPGNEATAQEAE
jgi:dolichyl-phosphate-mannose-protein mannosyltransferase